VRVASLVAAAVALLCVSSLGSSAERRASDLLTQRQPADVQRAPAPSGQRPTDGEVLRLKTVAVNDPVIGRTAFTILSPVDWQSEGAVLWRFNPVNCAAPATFTFHALAPGGSDELWVLPLPTFSWARSGIPFFPEGSFYLGNEVRAPVEATRYVQMYVLPRFRRSLQGARITTVQNLPDLAHTVLKAQERVPFPLTASAGRVSVEYQQNGRLMQEDIYSTMLYHELMPGGFWWGPASSFSFKSEKGRLERHAPLFRAMVMSVTPDLHWYNRYMQWVDVCTQMAIKASNEAVVRSQIISRTNDQINDTRRKAWQNRQDAQARTSQKWDDYIRGVERYHNPFEGRQVEVPSGYDHVWVNRLGEYRLTPSHNYNPNIGSNQEWRELKK
jgi:hypothetical protein